MAVSAEEVTHPSHSSLKEKIDRAIASFKIQEGSLALSIYDLSSKELVYARDADFLMNIASVSKLFTSFAALEFLGAARVFETEVLYEGRKGSWVKKLYLKGGGDPTLDTSSLNMIALSVKESGIKQINSLILDDSLFDGEIFPPMYDTKKSDAYYRAPVSALSVESNAVTITVIPAKNSGIQPEVRVSPSSGYIRIKNSANTVEKRGSPLKVDAEEGDSKTIIRISGEVQLKSEPIIVKKMIYHPTLNAGYHFAALLKSHGISVKEVKLRQTPVSAVSLLKKRSKPLREIVTDMMKHSSNFIAEMLIKHIGAVAGQPGNFPKGMEKLMEIAEKAEIASGEILLKNGSGLYDANYATPAAIIKFLTFAEKEKRFFPEILASLPVSGTDGTLAKKFTEQPLKGFVRAKTGTLNEVRTLAGYLFDGAGRVFAFTFLLNCKKCEIDMFYKTVEEILTAVSSHECRRDKEGEQQ